MKPNFLVIGAARSGTTSLFKYLDPHPEIFMSDIKEINFFSNEKYWQKGFEWYERHFRESDHKIRGEASTSYTRTPANPGVAQRIYDYIPDVKMIYLLRDPVKRFVSHYMQRVNAGFEDREFEDIVRSCPDDRTLVQGKYAYQLDQYMPYFDREQIFVVTIDELSEKPRETMTAIYRFLGVGDHFETSRTDVRHNANQKITKKGVVGKALINFYHEEIEQRNMPYRIKKAFRALGEIDSRVIQPVKPDTDTRARLIEYYRADCERLRDLYDVNIDGWLAE